MAAPDVRQRGGPLGGGGGVRRVRAVDLRDFNGPGRTASLFVSVDFVYDDDMIMATTIDVRGDESSDGPGRLVD